jgi:hypothetical protein
MLRLAVAFVSCLLISAASQADEYAWEVSGAGSSDSGSVIETDNSFVATTYYFGSVKDDSGPYALATFYDPITRISASVSQEKRTVDVATRCFPSPCTPTRLHSSTTADDYRMSGRYVLPGSRWYFGGSYSGGRTDLPPTLYPASQESRDYGVLVGKYLGPKTSLEFSGQSSLDRLKTTVVSCGGSLFFSCAPSESAVIDTKNDHAALSAQHVRRFRGLTYSLIGRVAQTAGRQDVDIQPLRLPNPVAPVPPIGGIIGGVVVNPLFNSISLGRYREYAVGADLFPTAKVGVRVGYSTFDGDTLNSYSYGVGASWFITRHVGLRFDFDRARSRFALPDVDTATMQVIGRF